MIGTTGGGSDKYRSVWHMDEECQDENMNQLGRLIMSGRV